MNPTPENLSAIRVLYRQPDTLALWGVPYDMRAVKQWLAARGFGRLETKKRGVPLEPEKLRRELANDGADAATVLLAKISGRVKAIVARRMEK
jgi:hypothetical protein